MARSRPAGRDGDAPAGRARGSPRRSRAPCRSCRPSCSQPRRRKAACTGSSSRRAARRARVHALGGDLAVAEEPLAQADAAHLQALELQRRQPLADDELGAAAADVDDQAPARLARHGVRHAGVDEPRLFHAGDDLDRVAERLAGALEEGLLAMGAAQRVGPDDADAVGVHVAQPLAEALQAGQRARRRPPCRSGRSPRRRRPGAPSRAADR